MTCVATSASALDSFHLPNQTSISNQPAQTGSSTLPYAQKTNVYGSNPLKKPFTSSNAVIPASGGISNTSHGPLLTKTFPTGNAVISANGGISSTSHLPFPTNGGPAAPASTSGPIVVAVPGRSEE